MVYGQNGSGQNGMGKWYGQNGTDKILGIKSLINPAPIDNKTYDFFTNPTSAFLYVLIIYL